MPVIGTLGFMDSLERFKEKQKIHAQHVKKEREEIIPAFIHCSLALVIFYYEAFSNIESDFTFAGIGPNLFVFIIYFFVVLIFCVEVTKNFIIKCILLVSCHAVCIYLWIWVQNPWAMAYFVGLIFSATKLLMFGKHFAARNK